MFKRTYPVFRVALVLIFALALSAVFTSSAQSTALTQIAKSLDGQISVRVPQGWQSRDAAGSIFTSALAFGDSGNALQAAINSVSTSQTTVIPGMYGVVGIVSPQLVASLSPDLAVSTMLNALITGVQQQGADIVDQESYMIGGVYPGSIAVVDIGSIKLQTILGAFHTGTDVVIFSIGGSPESTYSANEETLFNIVDSISIPAESGNALPTAAATSIPVQTVAPVVQGNVVTSTSGTFSASLPEGYVSQPITGVPNFGDVIVFGADQQALQAAFNVVVSGQKLTDFQGVGGMLGVIDPKLIAGAPLDQLAPAFVGRLTPFVVAAGAQAVGQPQARTFAGQYAGQIQELNVGFVAAMHSTDQVLIAIVFSHDMNTDLDAINGILDSVRIPAESGGLVVTPEASPSEEITVVTPESVPTQEASPAAPQTVRSSDERLSLVLPAGWTVIDHVADQNILAYGDSDAAAQSRLHSAKPDLAPETAISGSGGLVILYPMSQFGIDPNNPDLSGLMQRALGGLKGYTVEQAAAPLEPGSKGLIAIINGTERGLLALIPFGDQIAYVTATVGSSADFEANAASLLNIVESVHIPAVVEPTPTPTSTPVPTAAGLGGLGGLEAQTLEPVPLLTPEVTPTVTPGGLGGL